MKPPARLITKLIYADIYGFSNLGALCLLWIRAHLDLPSDISVLLFFLCVLFFRRKAWKTLGVIPPAASDTSQLTQCASIHP